MKMPFRNLSLVVIGIFVLCIGTALTGWGLNYASMQSKASDASGAQAKRTPPPEVAPVIDNGITYAVPSGHPTTVAASDANGKELWRTEVYKNVIDPQKERDVQEVFISSLESFEEGVLQVTDERKRSYFIDMKTGQYVVKGAIFNMQYYLWAAGIGAVLILASVFGYLLRKYI